MSLPAKHSPLPPTPEDAQLSLRHHVDSVDYNLRHATDHLKGTSDHLAKLRTVGGDQLARRHARKVQRALQSQLDALAPHLR